MTLKERVNKSGITKKKLAEKLGVSHVQLSYWLNGTRQIPEEKERKLKNILDKADKVLS